MPKQHNWIWKFYFLFYLFSASLNLSYFFSTDSPIFRYYQIGIAFNIYFFGIYFLNLTSVILNILSVFPLCLYAFKINFLSKQFWRWFLILRFAFDVTGHNYEINLLKSISHDSVLLGIKTLLTYAILTLPSYLGLYDHAFGHEKEHKKAPPTFP